MNQKEREEKLQVLKDLIKGKPVIRPIKGFLVTDGEQVITYWTRETIYDFGPNGINRDHFNSIENTDKISNYAIRKR
jgi:hypothetical protein